MKLSKVLWIVLAIYAVTWIALNGALQYGFANSFERLNDGKGCYVFVERAPVLQCPSVTFGSIIEYTVNGLWHLWIWALILPGWIIGALFGPDTIEFPYSLLSIIVLLIEISVLPLLLVLPIHEWRKIRRGQAGADCA